MKARRDVFQAIADPTRRAILLLIAAQSMTPNTIAEEFKTSRQAVSRHIRILTECGLVKQDQKGREIYYHINASKIKEIDKWVERLKDILQTQFGELDKILSAMKKSKN
jgi:DNA-binding transcriptional ArsR family regulator